MTDRVRNAIKNGEIDALGVTRDPIEVESYRYDDGLKTRHDVEADVKRSSVFFNSAAKM